MTRNLGIFRSVCRGYTLGEVGTIYGLSASTVRVIVHVMVKILAERKHIEKYHGIYSLALMRKNKNRLISMAERFVAGHDLPRK